jgi:hypothetical protein
MIPLRRRGHSKAGHRPRHPASATEDPSASRRAQQDVTESILTCGQPAEELIDDPPADPTSNATLQSPAASRGEPILAARGRSQPSRSMPVHHRLDMNVLAEPSPAPAAAPMGTSGSGRGRERAPGQRHLFGPRRSEAMYSLTKRACRRVRRVIGTNRLDYR